MRLSGWAIRRNRMALPSFVQTCGGSVFVRRVRHRLRPVGVRFTGIAFQSCKSDDLALVIDGACGLQIQSGVWGNQSIHVSCGSVAPKRCPGAEARADGDSQYQALVVDGDGRAVRVTGHCSEIGDVALLPKTVKARVASGVRGSHNLPFVIQAGSVDPGKPPVSAKASQVESGRRAREQHEEAA